MALLNERTVEKFEAAVAAPDAPETDVAKKSS